MNTSSQANPVLLALLLEMGIPRIRAEKGLLNTGNKDAELALNWALEHANDADIDAPLPAAPPAPLGNAAALSALAPRGMLAEGEWKMVILVRDDLKMGVGKVAAQCSHAAVGLYKKLLKHHKDGLRMWEENGQMKIVLRVDDIQQMTQLEQLATSFGLPVCAIADAGRTEVAPGTQTVLAIAGKTDDLRLRRFSERPPGKVPL